MKKIYLIIIAALFFYKANLHGQTSATWTQTGPINFPTDEVGQINGIGRICQFKFHPSNSSIMYAISATGSLWKSTDEAQTWHRTGTDNLPYTSSASVCIDYTDDQILYLGTGDPDYYSRGLGIWKSTDGGTSWEQSTFGVGNRLVAEILMDPLDHNALLAATDDGIWKSTDAGATWSEKKTGGNFTDMILKPNLGTRTVYAATHTEFFVSYDMGDTWTQIALPGSGFSNGGRIGVTAADTNRVYVTFVGDYNTGLNTPVLKSTNSGQSFTIIKPANTFNLNGYTSSSSGQGNYNYDMTADPVNPNLLYIVGELIWKSTDGGATWSQLEYSWTEVIHTDMHQIEVSPYDHTKLFNANDGGLWVSLDQGNIWTPTSNGLCITEFYHAVQSKTSRDTLYGGTQDNGELYMAGESDWFTNRGGDWASKMAMDNQNYVYYFSNGTRRTFTNPEESFNMPVQPDANNSNGNNIYIKFSPIQSDVAFLGKNKLYTCQNINATSPAWDSVSIASGAITALAPSPVNANVLYVVTDDQHVYRTDNALDAAPSFNAYTAPAPTNLKASIAIVKTDPNVVYLTCGSRVFRSSDQGASWTEITYNLPPVNILSIYNDAYSTDESMYLATPLAVYYKNNTMTSWMNYSDGLPTVAHINEFMLFNDGTSRSTLRVAYYGRGVWEAPLIRNSSIHVSVTSPSDSALFPEGSTIELQAEATSSSGSITKVEFYNGSTLLGTANSSPYSYSWNNVPAGNYSISAKAYTTSGSNTSPFLVRLEVLKLQSPDMPASPQPEIVYNYYQGVFNYTTDLANTTPIKTGIISTFNLSPATQREDFGLIFTGYINVPTDGIYTFYTSSDDGSVLYIGNKLVVNNDGLHSQKEVSSVIGLKAGLHAIKVAYIQQAVDSSLHVFYSGPGITKQEIPGSVLFHNAPACSFGTPLSTALSSMNYTYYSHAYTLGQGGPDLSNVTSFTIQWDLSQNGLYTLAFNISNGIPAYYIDLRTVSANTFNQASPSITFTNSEIAGLDGTYYVAHRSNGDFVMASTTGQYTLYFTNSSTKPACSPNARMAMTSQGGISGNTFGSTSEEGTILWPNPAQDNVTILTGMDLTNSSLRITDIHGLSVSANYTTSENKIDLNTSNTEPGMYTVTIQTKGQTVVKKMVISR